jgi:hypothetical protein
MKQVFIVSFSTGEYSEWRVMNVAAFATVEAAILFEKTLNAKLLELSVHLNSEDRVPTHGLPLDHPIAVLQSSMNISIDESTGGAAYASRVGIPFHG